jgi:hypothetical protein
MNCTFRNINTSDSVGGLILLYPGNYWNFSWNGSLFYNMYINRFYIFSFLLGKTRLFFFLLVLLGVLLARISQHFWIFDWTLASNGGAAVYWSSLLIVINCGFCGNIAGGGGGLGKYLQ